MKWYRVNSTHYLRDDNLKQTGYRIYVLKKGRKKMLRASHYDPRTDKYTRVILAGDPTLSQAKKIVAVIAKLEN